MALPLIAAGVGLAGSLITGYQNNKKNQALLSYSKTSTTRSVSCSRNSIKKIMVLIKQDMRNLLGIDLS